MNCMKCGRDTEQNQIFCRDCLEEMERYPVKPGTVVQLPAQPPEPQIKKAGHRRQTPTPEEQVKRLKKRSNILFLALSLTAALAIFLGLSSYHLMREMAEQKAVGQNYSTIIETTAPTETVAPTETAPQK